MSDFREWVGPSGIPSRMWRAARPAGLALLEARGCGAWVGDHACGRTPVRAVVGGSDLLFATYRAAADAGTGLVSAALCALHDPLDGEAPERLTADMREDVLRRQRAELRRFFRLQGESLPVPNLLEPEAAG